MRQIREDDLAEIIGIWYLEWKDSIVDYGIMHRLGFAKEDLKLKIEKFLATQEGEKCPT